MVISLGGKTKTIKKIEVFLCSKNGANLLVGKGIVFCNKLRSYRYIVMYMGELRGRGLFRKNGVLDR